jgi:hypothetical protein
MPAPGSRAVHPGVDLEEDDAMTREAHAGRPYIDEAIHATERALDGCQGRPPNLSMT